MKRWVVGLSLALCLYVGVFCQNSLGQTKGGMNKKLYGLNFSPYVEGQNPHENAEVSEAQIISRMKIIAPYTEWIRTFSCTRGMEKAGEIAHQMGLKAAIGAWLDIDVKANEREIAGLIKAGKSGDADILIVGNEVLFHRHISEEQLIAYLRKVKKEVPQLPVTTVEIYNEILRRPKLAEACDVIMINCYPFWEKRDIREALNLHQLVYKRVKSRFPNKEIIFSEVGWPSRGKNLGLAIPSLANAEKFFWDFTSWAEMNNIPYYYFEAFDESWKADYETELGAYWGIWDQNGKPKWDISKFKVK